MEFLVRFTVETPITAEHWFMRTRKFLLRGVENVLLLLAKASFSTLYGVRDVSRAELRYARASRLNGKHPTPPRIMDKHLGLQGKSREILYGFEIEGIELCTH